MLPLRRPGRGSLEIPEGLLLVVSIGLAFALLAAAIAFAVLVQVPGAEDPRLAPFRWAEGSTMV